MENSEVMHKEKKHRFYIELEGYEARLKYKMKKEEVLEVYKIDIPLQLRGKGLAKRMMQTVLNYIQEYGYKIKPTCSFAQKFMERNPQYNFLLAS